MGVLQIIDLNQGKSQVFLQLFRLPFSRTGQRFPLVVIASPVRFAHAIVAVLGEGERRIADAGRHPGALQCAAAL